MYYYSLSFNYIFCVTEEDIEEYVSSFLTDMYIQLNIKDGDVTDLQALDECLDGLEPETVAKYVTSALRGIPVRAVIKAEEFGTQEGNRCIIIADEETNIIRYYSWDNLIGYTMADFYSAIAPF